MHSAVSRPRLKLTLLVLSLALFVSCSSHPDSKTLVMLIESSPTNLDPRVGLDGQSERIDNLIFDDLLERDERLNVKPGLADNWEIPDPLTYVFHLRPGVKFHNGAALTSRDVKWTFDSLLAGKIRSTKSAAYRLVDHVDAPNDLTVVFHLKQSVSTLLWNLSDGAIGIVPYGTLNEMSDHPLAQGRSASSRRA
jgi:peptide/nickel transport system substrate-binding protein